jgi:pyruvate,water dikinase
VGTSTYTLRFEDLRIDDVPVVGGKNASLGELIGALGAEEIRAPEGFASTADAYRAYVSHNGLGQLIASEVAGLRSGRRTLAEAGDTIRSGFLGGQMPTEVSQAISDAYGDLGQRLGLTDPVVAVRSSATAEDLPEASFAGQQESFLNVVGADPVIDAVRSCFASLFSDRAISYREEMDFEHHRVALSVGVQRMVRSDLSGAGVIFTLDPESGFRDLTVISAAWGLGEGVVKGILDPDQYSVFDPLLGEGRRPIVEMTLGGKEIKVVYRPGSEGGTLDAETTPEERRSFVLSEDEILQLAGWAKAIERHYGMPMDIEWAKDGETNEMFIVQARPETVQARAEGTVMRTFQLREKAEPVVTGVSVGSAIVTGTTRLIEKPGADAVFEEGDILVAHRTDPDWGPLLTKAGGVVTDHGGRTSHAAIVSRELGIPAVVGSGDATKILTDPATVTLSTAEGDEGYVYPGALDFEISDVSLEGLPEPRTRIMLNVGNPAAAFRWWQLPVRGIGLARIEFIISELIRVHPMALLDVSAVEDAEVRAEIEALVQGYDDPTDYFVERLARGVARLAASQYPEPVVVRTSDFKTNEYAGLLGGEAFEPQEENPMLGFRGASRYYSDRYRPAFELECRALKRARTEMGFTNIIPMIPFCRTPEEADRVLEVMADEGLKRGEDGLEVYVMCEVPSNVVLTEEFAARFDGLSIGSNDLTQLTLGVDRDSVELAHLFDERDEAVKRMISDVIERAHAVGTTVGICGQAPSDHPDFAEFLVEAGIDSISLNPDSVIGVVERVAALEEGLDPGPRIA